MKSFNHLPEELIREILHYGLLIPENEFFDEYLRAARRARREHESESPQWHILLVCKKWRRIGEPSLYTSLCIANVGHTRSLAKLFKSRPSLLARNIQHVRLEGGYMDELSDILEHATNLKTLSVSTTVPPSEESITGLQRALPLLKPVRLYIWAPELPRDPTALAIYGSLESIIRTCTSLVSFVLHYGAARP